MGLTEGLGALGWLRAAPLLGSWLAVGLVCCGVAWRQSRRLSVFLRETARGLLRDRLLLAAGGLVFLLLGLCALFSPPNNHDSLSYHLARMEFWLSQGSLAFFATENLRQLEFGPLNSALLLSLRVLSGDDHALNLLQTAFLGGMLLPCVSWLMEQLGAGRHNRRLGLLVLLATPMVLLQACSTQNDLLVCSFLMAFIALALSLRKGGGWSAYLLLGVSAGLALLTKGTALVYGPPFVLLLLQKPALLNVRRHVLRLVVSLVLALALNAPHAMRNIGLSGWPTGVGAFSNAQQAPGLKSTAALALMNASLHLPVYAEGWEEWGRGGVLRVREVLTGIPREDTSLQFAGMPYGLSRGWRMEDFAGNPLQILVIVGTALLLLPSMVSRRGFTGPVQPFGLCLVLACLGFCAVFNWQIWGSRLHCFLFVAGITWAASRWTLSGRRSVLLLGLGALLTALPVLLFNQTRPLLGSQSILLKPRDAQWYASAPQLQTHYEALLIELSKTKPAEVGLHFGDDSPVYPLLRYLIRTDPGISFRHVLVGGLASSLERGALPIWLLSDRLSTKRFVARGCRYTKVWGSGPYTLYRRSEPPRGPLDAVRASL